MGSTTLQAKFSVNECEVLFIFFRRGHDDLGDHYLDCGDLSNALKCYSRARDYCTSAKHVVNMCLNVIKVTFTKLQNNMFNTVDIKGLTLSGLNLPSPSSTTSREFLSQFSNCSG